MKNGINNFLSETTLKLHKCYADNLKLRYSILEKTYPEIIGKELKEICYMKIKSYKEEIIKLKAELICHELYFSSFGEPYQSSSIIRENYRTEASFIYMLSEECKNCDAKFFIIFKNRNKIEAAPIFDYTDFIKIREPCLALDLCEHAYILDYELKKENYIDEMLKYMNLKKLQ